MTIEWEDSEKIDLRIGTITQVEDFPEAKRPAYKIWVNLGELGIKKSSAQITTLYKKEELLGKQVLCVCNFRPRQVGPFMSEILVTGLYDENKAVHLVTVDGRVPDGANLC